MAFTIRAPGKTILFGEHAVVHSQPAIAASVGLHTFVTVDEKTAHLVELDFPALELNVSFELADFAAQLSLSDLKPTPWHSVGRTLDPTYFSAAQALARTVVPASQPFALTAVTAFVYLYLAIFLSCDAQRANPHVRFTTNGTLPVGAGLGSSASYSVALSAALLKLVKALHSDSAHEPAMELVTAFSFLGECCIHGNPSGIDNLVATRGGAVYYRPAPRHSRELPTTRVYAQLPPLGLVLTDTQVTRRTSDQVAKVAQIREQFPQLFASLMDLFGEVVNSADALLSASSDPSQLALELGKLAEINHGLLAACGVSHPALERVRETAAQLQLGSTKLTGAGGGGCAITLTAELSPNIDALRALLPSCRVFQTQVGGPGVGWADAGAYSVEELTNLDWRHW